MKIDVNKKYKTVGGDTVVFSNQILIEIEEREGLNIFDANERMSRNMMMYPRRANRVQPIGESRNIHGSLFYGSLVSNGRNNREILCWNEDGEIIRDSIPPMLLSQAFTKEEADRNIEAFNLVEYDYTDITKYFKDRAEGFNKLVLDYKDVHNVLYNIAKGICTNGTSKELTEKINKYDALAREIFSILEKDINAVRDMEVVDAMLLYTVENELKKFTASIEAFNTGYLNSIKLSIASDVYGYVPVENNNYVKITPIVMTDGSVKLYGPDGKEIKTDEDAQ